MKLSENWLREWANPSITLNELAQQLTLAGIEIEEITPVSPDFNQVIIGEVIEVYPHPNATRLRVCSVKIGAAEKLNIVCGAPNVKPGLKVAVATIGARLPQNIIIQETMIRDVMSQGMLCSQKELGLVQNAEGIMELPLDAPLGESLRSWMDLNDNIINVHLTTNRGDCLSIRGLAREVAALNKLPLVHKSFASALTPQTDSVIPIHVSAVNACPIYYARIIKNLNTQVQTPLLIKERLQRSGISSIHPVVDITNYVLLELGQPLQAFDLNKLSQEINIRFSEFGEKLVLLEGKEISLDEKTLIIADAVGPQGIAGVIGGEHSSVTESTDAILIEAALFASSIISGCARRYGINSEAAYRFERGVDPAGVLEALNKACELIMKIMGGTPGPLISGVNPPTTLHEKSIFLRRARIAKILGVEFPDELIESRLSQLAMTLIKKTEGWEVTVPSYRLDLQEEIDLIEEITRLNGYQEISSTLPLMSLKINNEVKSKNLDIIRLFLRDKAYHEAITYSFTSPELHHYLTPNSSPIILKNPISPHLSVMRSHLWAGLLEAVIYNQKRQRARVRLFETGLSFEKVQGEIIQTPQLALVSTGEEYVSQWGVKEAPQDFYTFKKTIEGLLACNRQSEAIDFKSSEHPALHPGQTSAIISRITGKTLGFLGALHPKIQTVLEIEGPIYLFEIELLSLLEEPKPAAFVAFSKFPQMRRDISFFIEKLIPFALIKKTIKEIGEDWLKEADLFDVYIPSTHKDLRSLGVALIFQHSERTLTDEEADARVTKIIEVLREKFMIKLRDAASE